MKGDKEARKQMSDEAILVDDGAKLALMLSRLGECQVIQKKVIRAEKTHTETGLALKEQETIEENELWRLHQEKRAMYMKSIS